MGLRDLAAQDLRAILEDSAYGFGWDITVRDPSGVSADMVGYSNDISQVIDPDTGLAVSGRLASVALIVASLTAKCLGTPVGIADSKLKPWVITFKDINGNSYSFKVQQSNPDRTLGMVVCLLEFYK